MGELKGSALSLNKCIKYADSPTLLVLVSVGGWKFTAAGAQEISTYVYLVVVYLYLGVRSLHYFSSDHMVIRISTDLAACSPTNYVA